MNKLVKAIKKVTKKSEPKVEVEAKKEVVCSNCENSGKECRVCGFGTQPVL